MCSCCDAVLLGKCTVSASAKIFRFQSRHGVFAIREFQVPDGGPTVLMLRIFGVLTHRCATAHARVGGLDAPVGEYPGLGETDGASSLENSSNCVTTNWSAKLGPLSCSMKPQ